MGVKGVMQRVLPGRRRRSADATTQDLSVDADAAPSTPPAEEEAPASPQYALDEKFSPGSSGVAGGVGHEAALTVGCFDVFHRGHKALIDRLMAMGDVISVGCVLTLSTSANASNLPLTRSNFFSNDCLEAQRLGAYLLGFGWALWRLATDLGTNVRLS